ncbi:hypothetical protein CDAR_403161 [Caerostris darwini]|uniref:Ribosomal protein S11 n=1 Tax=Caerostris darwini TaxID=1538125 RepID=A0AAV4WZQ3_9ARAC|nr:hypothetical protein CDAR_403161 [Caerostris darwini]
MHICDKSVPTATIHTTKSKKNSEQSRIYYSSFTPKLQQFLPYDSEQRIIKKIRNPHHLMMCIIKKAHLIIIYVDARIGEKILIAGGGLVRGLAPTTTPASRGPHRLGGHLCTKKSKPVHTSNEKEHRVHQTETM